jgi:hypothetical protein
MRPWHKNYGGPCLRCGASGHREPEIIAKVEHGMRRLGGLDAEIPYIRYLLAVDPGDPEVRLFSTRNAKRWTRHTFYLQYIAGKGDNIRGGPDEFERGRSIQRGYYDGEGAVRVDSYERASVRLCGRTRRST